MKDYSEILEKARELSSMIENHEFTVEYMQSLEKMQTDVTAQKLLSDLIRVGREISESMNKSGTGPDLSPSESDFLTKELEKNETVKNHILAQKKYLDLIQKVQERIKNPREQTGE